ncbi:MAG TPA: 4-hydroxyphenylpyruvate dioxygenase [Alphaproteobacteria bacterium]|nr:4-hydroxyphenylpyruvate dioxygenase [Alphaproteobacteria bacterium]
MTGETEFANPMGTDGFEFVEFTAPDAKALGDVFEALGFRVVGRHRSKNVLHYRQGDINLIVNAEPASPAEAFAAAHGPSACAMAFRVKDAAAAYQLALSNGARPFTGRTGPMELNIPAIEGIGGSALYLVDRYGGHTIYDVDFVEVGDRNVVGAGLKSIDHLTHNVFTGRMDHWAHFYESLFNFREIRYFDIEGKLTGLRSRALTSPDGRIRIPLNESADDKSQIAEYLEVYKGEGIQHLALSTDDIYATVAALKAKGIPFAEAPPDSYYEMLDERLPNHGEPVEQMKALGILADGSHNRGLLLQIFTTNLIGPIFFEIIQRKGDEGFGEGNFKALFESMERDQIRRGVLQDS